jgi:Fur family transcriptional regulator, ferric uptake regulator
MSSGDHRHRGAHEPIGDIHQIATRRLARHGQRYTSGRRSLVELLARSPHPLTIPEILDAARLAQSTVYRNLGVLEEAGVVGRVITNGEWGCYELAEDLTGHHHHLICDVCGAVRDVEVPGDLEQLLESALGNLAESEGFVLDRHRLDLVGRCATCRDSG